MFSEKVSPLYLGFGPKNMKSDNGILLAAGII
jgi:hypothetical protein